MTAAKPMFEMIAAYTIPGRVLGDSTKRNGLPWGPILRKDQIHFQDITANNTLLIGAGTEPYVRHLHLKKGRHVIVIADRMIETPCIVVPTLQEALLLTASDPDRYGNPIVGGGARTFEQSFALLQDAQQRGLGTFAILHATEVYRDYHGDVMMPELPESWHETERTPQKADNEGGPMYDFVTYRSN